MSNLFLRSAAVDKKVVFRIHDLYKNSIFPHESPPQPAYTPHACAVAALIIVCIFATA